MSGNKINSEAKSGRHEDRLRELRSGIARWIGLKSIAATAVPDLFLFRRDQPGEPETVLYEPCLCVLAQGAKRIYPGEGSFVYNSARFLLAAIDFPTVAEVIEASPESPCLGIVLNIDLREVSQLMLDNELPSPRARRPELGISAGEITTPLLDAVSRLIGQLDEPDDIPVMTPIIKREIIYRLLISDQGDRLRQIATNGSRSNQISRAIDWLKQNFARPLKVEELAASVNMSISTFHHHFRSLTARSPLQYQKWLRLNEARRLMLVERMDASNAAFAVGYVSPSHFSREYSRLFGDSPARDISNLRRQTGT